MNILTLFGIALALAMDAFAVALSAGICLSPVTGRHLFRLGFHFGLFQALMPVIGWFAGSSIHSFVGDWDRWIAFIMLVLVGGKMIYEASTGDEKEEDPRDPTRGFSLVFLSVATSIDALAVGISLAMIKVSIWVPALVIGVVCAVLTVCGLLIGCRVGNHLGERVELLGGIVLIAIGVKIAWLG